VYFNKNKEWKYVTFSLFYFLLIFI
jgi:hypothetical protein